MKWLAFILMVLTPAAYAHPLDDRAQMMSEVVIVSDQRLEYVLHFRYLDVIASITEIDGGLDGNKDGLITAPELKRRFNVLVDELILPITIRVDGEPLALTPDFDRFLFQDLNRTGPLDLQSGVPTDTLRIHYRFVFYCDLAAPLQPGSHEVEYSFNSGMSVISAISEQMVAFDARKQPRTRIHEVTHSASGIPTMTFDWVVAAAEIVPEPEPTDPPIQPAPPSQTPEPPINIPAWITLFAGVVVAIAGVVSAIRKRRQALVGSLLMIVAGLAVVAAALARLELLTLN